MLETDFRFQDLEIFSMISEYNFDLFRAIATLEKLLDQISETFWARREFGMRLVTYAYFFVPLSIFVVV